MRKSAKTERIVPVGIAVVGARGRMGQRLIRHVIASPDFVLCGALERGGVKGDAGEAARGEAVGIAYSADPKVALATAQVVVDFSAPAQAHALAPLCAKRRCAYVVASTALTPKDLQAIKRASRTSAVLVASNLSIGVNVLAAVVKQVSQSLAGSGSLFDVEIAEIHHRHKKDAPSGTALSLANVVRAGGMDLRDTLGRQGSGARSTKSLGIAAVRGGDVAGEHTVYFLGDGERLELTHRAGSAEIFAQGALVASRWLVQQKPGLYTMADVLGL